MRFHTLSVLALSCALAPLAAAQTPTETMRHLPRPGQTTELPASAASVKPSDTVITIGGACKSGGETDCVTSVSREQFEKMATAIKPQMTTTARRNFAIQYARILAFSNQARALGLENEPRFKEIMKFVTDQLLVEALNQHYSDEYSNPSDQKIEDYYNQNRDQFREADLQRIIIPSQPAAAEVKKPTEEEEQAYVEKVRKEWIGGADPATLQKDALGRMGLHGSVPDVDLKNQTPGMIPSTQASVFNLKPGEISQPFVDAGAAYIYKMISEQEKPLSEVKGQIAHTLHDQMMRDKIQELNESVKSTLNDAYFGPEPKPEAPEPGGDAHEQHPGEPAGQNNSAPAAPPKK
jgi:hypothetical protein